MAGILISISIWQIQFYRKVPLRLQRQKVAPRERAFLSRQAFRRLQIHLLLGISGVAILFGLYLPPKQMTLPWTIAWLVSILALCWAMLLACVDFISIKLFFLGAERTNELEQIRIKYLMKKWSSSDDDQAGSQDNSTLPESDEDDPKFSSSSRS